MDKHKQNTYSDTKYVENNFLVIYMNKNYINSCSLWQHIY